MADEPPPDATNPRVTRGDIESYLASKEYLTRKEAAAFLRSIGFPIAPSTLATLTSHGKGPPYMRLLHKIGTYKRVDLEGWARENSVMRGGPAPATGRGK